MFWHEKEIIDATVKVCEESIKKIQRDSNPRITLIIKGKWTKSGKKKLIQLPNTPYGNIFADACNNRLLVSFDAKEVLEFCENYQRENSY